MSQNNTLLSSNPLIQGKYNKKNLIKNIRVNPYETNYQNNESIAIQSKILNI